ncbi:hypothetical protein [Actinomadura hibisca]|uniref:hypothetical protein n=1 Tax=Actinomadura hibisca TaxID=68565 RepID=UPI000AA5CBA5|nr:hypothetical protein [Actinomadura hibisca]
MTAHLSDSDRQALRLAHDLREEMRLALPQPAAAPSVSPFVDPAGRPSVLMRMDAETARALMAVLGERRRGERHMEPPPEPRRADGTHVPPQMQYPMAQQMAQHAPQQMPHQQPSYPMPHQMAQFPPQSHQGMQQPMVPAGQPMMAAPPAAGQPGGPAPLLPSAFPAR